MEEETKSPRLPDTSVKATHSPRLPEEKRYSTSETFDAESSRNLNSTVQKRGKKFAQRVPETILQQTLQSKTNDPPNEILSLKILKALKEKLHGYKDEQCAILVQNMTKLTLSPNTVVIPENKNSDALFYLESGTLKSSDGIHMIMKDTLFGDVFCDHDQPNNGDLDCDGGLTTQDQCILWKISRLLFQAVLINYSKSMNASSLNIISSVPMLAPLSPSQQQRVADVMLEVFFPKDSIIIEQGQAGNTMYFIKSGQVTVKHHNRGEAEAKKLDVQGSGTYFGETALLDREEAGADGGIRTADCIATEDTICYSLEREDMLRLLGPLQSLMIRKSKAKALNNVELLSSTMSKQELEEVASLLERKHFNVGDKVITQGEDGDDFFIIEQGEITFTRKQDKESGGSGIVANIGTFFAHQFFGEGSLLDNKPRRATATASQPDTSCFVLNGTKFREMFDETIIRKMRHVLDMRKQADALQDVHTLVEEVEVTGDDEEKRDSFVLTATSSDDNKKLIHTSTKSNLMSKTLSSHNMNTFVQPEDLNAISVLGEGSYGKVTLVRHKTTGRTFALKQITKCHVKKMKQEKHIQTERKVISCVNHPFVCNLIRTFKNVHSVYFLMEAVLGGELYTQLKKFEKFSSTQTKLYIGQVTSVFEHLHLHDIIFRDLKPENLLIGIDGYIKMVDFGLAKIVPNGKTYTLCGTPAYASPEVYASSGHNKGTDWWCLGVLLREFTL
jgi:CRP-like cAMP-binding protein